jgi:hypothetical protein
MKKHKPRPPKRKKRKNQNDGPVVVRHPFSGADPDALREALAKIGEQKAVDFPRLLGTLIDLIKRKYPPHALATLSSYGLHAGVSDQGVEKKSLSSGLLQFHIELFHALVLTVPDSQWGYEPFDPQEIQVVIDTVKELGDAFHQRRLAVMREDRDDQERTVVTLQEMLRMHTQIVRNWGYYSDVANISGELYGGLDDEFRAALGFTPTEYLTISRLIISTLEDRINQRFRTLKRIFRERKINKFVRRFFKNFPGVEGDPEDFIRIIPPGTPPEAVVARLLTHADIQLPPMYLIPVAEIAEKSGIAEGVIIGMLERLSMFPGELADGDPEHFFLSNPVWLKPVIKIVGDYFCPSPMSFFSHIHNIMRMFAEIGGLGQAIEKRRAIFLEEKVASILQGALPDAEQRSAVKWSWEGVEYETDHLVIFDRTAIIVEDKSAALTAAGLRGAPDRVKRHVRDLILAPSEQSARLQAIIEAAATDEKAKAALLPFKLDLSGVERFARISITLDDFSTLCSMENDLKGAGWIPPETRLATTMNIADLKAVVDILDRPTYLVDYLIERARVQKAVHIVGDELDYLGFYISTGLATYSFEKDGGSLTITGMSSEIDNYYESRDAGVNLPKPKVRTTPYFKSLIGTIEARRFPGWLNVSTDILRAASYDEQKMVEAGFNRIKSSVIKNWRDSKHECCMSLMPPETRNTVILFYAFPEALADKRRETANQLAADALDASNKTRCIVVARCIERWNEPYAFIYVARPGDESR